MNPSDFIDVAKKVYEVNSANKDAWREQMFQKRYKYFFSVWIYIAITVLFLFLGYWQKQAFFTIVHWYIYMILSWTFFVGGILTMLSYLWMIIKGKK